MTTHADDFHERLEGLARAATPGPWRWEVSLSARQVELCGGPPKSGFGKFDHSVMSFRRWGMGGAAPVFWSWDGHLGKPQRADDVAVPVEGREHHERWFRDIDHPNAAYIAAANPQAILKLIAENRALREALTPSGDTKAVYHGEFTMPVATTEYDEEGEPETLIREAPVPWTTVKEIMAAIRARAALTPIQQGAGE